MNKKIWEKPEVKILDVKRDTKNSSNVNCWPPPPPSCSPHKPNKPNKPTKPPGWPWNGHH